MDFTETEAKDKICPVNKQFCVGSGCMWWVSTDMHDKKKELPGGGFVVIGEKGRCGGICRQ